MENLDGHILDERHRESLSLGCGFLDPEVREFQVVVLKWDFRNPPPGDRKTLDQVQRLLETIRKSEE